MFWRINRSETRRPGKKTRLLALLWSLRQVSGRQLPLVIDTPLARLDDSHRTRLLHDFVPRASDQVVFLTTDAGLDGRLLGQAEPWLARAYRLHFDAREQETIVVENNVADVNLVVERLGMTVK